MAGEGPLRLERDSGVATLTIVRPEKKNALNFAMFTELARLIEDVAHESGDRVLVVRGTGDAFCAGADLTDTDDDEKMTRLGPLEGAQWMREINRAALALARLAKPSIAAVNGVAAGAGMNLALGCDIVFAAESARFTEIFVKRGLSVDFGGTWLLPRLVGLQRAKDLAFTGRIVDAREAEALGLVLDVLDDDALFPHVDAYARQLASLPPVPMSLMKHGLNSSYTWSMDDTLEFEARAQATCFGTDDIGEAMRAWLEKRPGTYSGR